MSPSTYRNEFILIAAVIALALAYGFKEYRQNRFHTLKTKTAKELQEVQEAIALQKIWKKGKVKQKLEALRNQIGDQKIVRWETGSKKITLALKQLRANELDRVLNKVVALPVEIVALSIHNEGERYRMECQCKR